MPGLSDEFLVGILTASGLAVLTLLMVFAVRWARPRSRGAIFAGALLSLLAPDPEFERKLRLAERARPLQSEEDPEDLDRHSSA